MWWEDDRVLTRRRETEFLSSHSLTKSLASFCGNRKWRNSCANFNRKWLGRELKHLRHAADRLWLKQNEDLSWRVHWNGDQVATLPSLDSLMGAFGKEVYIVVTGPSAKALDLSKLKGKSVMGGNGAIALLSEHGVVPTDYVITDRDFFEHRMDLVEKVILSGARCFFSVNGLARVCEHDKNLLEKGDVYLIETVDRYYGLPQIPSEEVENIDFDWMFLPEPSERKKLRIGWSYDISKGLFSGCTVAYIAGQVATSLGYKKLFFCGLDLGGKGRAYDEGDNMRPTTLDKDYDSIILPSFELMRKASGAFPFKVFNLSTVSRLPEKVLPSIGLEESLEVASL